MDAMEQCSVCVRPCQGAVTARFCAALAVVCACGFAGLQLNAIMTYFERSGGTSG